jgi:hypothetical protein
MRLGCNRASGCTCRRVCPGSPQDSPPSRYLAPALAGFALLIALALPPVKSPADGKRFLPVLLIVCASLALSYGTVRQDGEWWFRRAATRQEFVSRLLAIDRQVPAGDIAYVAGLSGQDFENLENGGIFKTYDLSLRKFKFLLPDFDVDLPEQLHRLAETGAIDRAYYFVFASGGVRDETASFRNHPEEFVNGKPIVFLDLPGVSVQASPAVVRRGRDSLTLKVINLDARAIDLLYSIDGQLMPPLLQWHLDAAHSATVFADMTTPAGDYRFRAIRNSEAAGASWIKVDTRISVR